MKPERFTVLLFTLLSLTLLSTVSRAASATPSGSATVAVVAAPGPDIASTKFTDIEQLTYVMRDPFLTGLKRLEAKVDLQIAELSAKRVTMNGNIDTEDWDFAMKEMNDARFYLKSMGEEASKASLQTWDQKKAKVGQAWVRTQNAYDEVKSSTTN